jgi:hypothetical protein
VARPPDGLRRNRVVRPVASVPFIPSPRNSSGFLYGLRRRHSSLGHGPYETQDYSPWLGLAIAPAACKAAMIHSSGGVPVTPPGVAYSRHANPNSFLADTAGSTSTSRRSGWPSSGSSCGATASRRAG